MPRLSDATLPLLPSTVTRPYYDRTTLTPGIVHLGLGAFHRAHQALYTDDCLNAGARDWAITAASLRSSATRNALEPQDNLYTIALRDGSETTLRVVGAITKTLVAPDNPAALLQALTAPSTRIVTLTITEKGYCANIATRSLNTQDPDILHDTQNPDSPRTALGFLATAIARRRAAGVAPFTLLSCDNLPANGVLLHTLLTQFAALTDPALARHIETAVASPTCMVDRIVPATTDADRVTVATATGLTDAWPVMAEPFGQWVIEDHFPTGRPDWQAEYTTDVAPFEAMKLRLLNGAHSTIAAFGRITGRETVAQVMADPTARAFIMRYWAEIAATLAPSIDWQPYIARLTARFDNTALNHKTAQIATDASQKVSQRILAPLHDLRNAQKPTPCTTFALVAWLRSCDAADEQGQPLTLNDPVLTAWHARPPAGASAAETVRAFLGFTPVFGTTLPHDETFAADLTAALTAIRTQGLTQAIRALLATQG
jgi:fructuronate reductase